MTAELYEKIKSYNQSFDQTRIKQAFDYVSEQYEVTDGSVSYPLAVLEILLPLKPDEDTIVAVLLHDLYLLDFLNEEKIMELFGPGVLHILSGLKKLVGLNYAENDKGAQMEILRKMFLTMAKDIRVILILLTSRIVQLSVLDSESDMENKLRIARETMNIYVPLASRLGIYRMKIQLEDLSFKYLDPEQYNKITSEIAKYGKRHSDAIDNIRDSLRKFLMTKGVKAEVVGRVKSIYSICKKLQRKGSNNLEDLYDFFAIRVILPHRDESVDQLYLVLGLIHGEWKPLSSRFKDYVSVPKPNGYRSLHTVVLGLAPKDMEQPVEIQIRDASMHGEAEYGIASHWIYKDSSSKEVDTHADWIRGLSHIHEFFDTETEVLQGVEVDVFKDRIFVLTPRGEVKDLPVGAIPIDFAYAVHTDVGNKCVMAKVNGNAVPLDYELKNGDVVEIVTRKDVTPKLRWLSMVKCSFARNKIKAWFSNQNRNNNLKEGRKLLNAQLERLCKPPLDQNYSILKNYGQGNLNISQRESLVEEVGKGGKMASDIVRKVYPYEKNLVTSTIVSRAEPHLSGSGKFKKFVLEEQVIVGGEEGLPIKIASCCSPKFGDSIIGYVTRGSRITVHKAVCRLLSNLDRERVVDASWKGAELIAGSHVRVGIKLVVVSRVGLIHDITSIITEMGINIVDIMISQAGSGLYEDCFLLDFDDFEKFDTLMDRLENIRGVVKVARSDNFK